MDITFDIQNIRNCIKAQFTASGITLIQGDNEAGKSSIAAAIAMVAARRIPGTKDEARFRRGSNAKVTMTCKDGSEVTVTLPNRKLQEKGEPPIISEFAAGLKSFPEMKLDDRSKELQRIIKAEATEDDFTAFFKGTKVDGNSISAAWERVKKLDWKKAHEFQAKRGQELKGQWAATAANGMDWGKVQSAPEAFLPPGWESSLEKTSLEDLTKQLTDEKDTLEHLTREDERGKVEYEKLQDEADKLAGYDSTLDELKTDQKAAAARYKSISEELQKRVQPTPPEPVNEQKTHPCPHCDKPLVIQSGKPMKAGEQPDQKAAKKALEEYKQLKKEYDDFAARVDAQAREVNELNMKVARAEEGWKKAKAAADKLKETKPPEDLEAIAKQNELIERHEGKIRAFKIKRECDRLHGEIMTNQIIIDALDPADGVRQKKLADSLDKFNAVLKKHCQTADWPVISISEDMDISHDAWLVEDISKGAFFRTQTIFQVAIAEFLGDQLLVVDDFEALSKSGRKGLFNLLQSLLPKMKSVVFMTCLQKDALDISGIGGQSFYMIDNVAKELVTA